MSGPSRPEWLVQDTLLASAERDPEKTAIVTRDGERSFAELADASLRLARAFQDLGLERGGRVVVQLENSFDCAAAIYGAVLAGGVFVVLNPQTKTDKLGFVLEDCSAEILVTQSQLLPLVHASGRELPALRRVLVAGGGDNGAAVSLTDAVASSEPAPASRTIARDLAALIYTSGSTGEPKGVMMTHASMVFTMQSLCTYLRLAGDDRILNCLPLAFDYGLYQLLMAVRMGATLVLERSFAYPAEVAARTAEAEVTVFPGIPTVYASLLALARSRPLELPTVRRVTNTAAALPPAFLDGLRQVFPNALLFAMYGLTECKRVAYLEPELLDERPSSVGTAIPGTEAFVLAEGRRARPHEVGLLHVRGPHVMAGYWNRPDLTDVMLVDGPTPGERMLNTQDFFTEDEDGFLYFVGRSDNIIKSGGHKVSPVEVENVLHSLPGVREAAVVGVPDSRLGETIRAFVVADEGEELTEAWVKARCRERLEGFMVPGEVVFVDELPRTDTGKVAKRSLAA